MLQQTGSVPSQADKTHLKNNNKIILLNLMTPKVQIFNKVLLFIVIENKKISETATQLEQGTGKLPVDIRDI